MPQASRSGKQDEYTQDNWWPQKAADKKSQRQFRKGEINEAGELLGGGGPERAGAGAASLCGKANHRSFHLLCARHSK